MAALALVAMIIGLSISARVQSGAGVSVETVSFKGRSGAPMRALLFRPRDATPAHPRPGVLAVHGYLNSAEIQANFATELARRGYVVLAPDQRGHGASAGPVFADGFGGPDALAYLRSLPYVDRDNIGLEGHSMGGWTVLRAAQAFPDGYRALVLEGSSVGAPFAPEGSRTFPRNLLVVYGKRDEFGGFMWGKPSPVRTGAAPKAMAAFGTTAPIEPGRLYGSLAAGDARLLLTPPVIHAWLHQSRAGVTPALNWFDQTLKGGDRRASDDQVWPWREAGNAMALIAVPFFLIGLIGMGTAGLSVGRPAAVSALTPADTGRGVALRLIAIALIPAVLYLPLTMAAEKMIGVNTVLRQTYSTQFGFWALCCALLNFAALAGLGRRRAPLEGGFRAVVVAGAALAATFALVLAADRLGHVNPSWWFITLRPLTVARFQDFLVYLPFFMAQTVSALWLIDTVRPLDKGPTWRAVGVSVATLTGGLLLFLALQYGVLVATGALLLAGEGLRTISAINFIPILAVVGGLGVVSRRWTGSVLTGALAAGALMTWMLTATQPIAG